MSARERSVVGALCLFATGCASPTDGVPPTRPNPATHRLSATATGSAIAEAPRVGAERLATRGPSCALLVGGGISCWAGELGSTPIRVAGVSDAIRVVTGHGEIAILRKSGELVIGAEDAAAFEGITDAIAYAREYDDRCVVRRDGLVSCAAVGARTLTKIQGISDARDISVGRAQSCALVGARGEVSCFQQRAEKPFAAPVKGLEGAIEVAAGAVVGCARKADSSVHCFSMQTPGWGAASAGSATAMTVGDLYDGVPTSYLCTASGHYARCRFVESSAGELSRGSEIFSITAPADIRQLSAGVGGVCALDATGQVTCTGSNNTGELALPAPGLIETPTKVDGFSPLGEVVLGNDFLCGLTRGGGVECSTRGSPPSAIPGFDAPLTSLSGLGEVVCGATAAGAVSCFDPEKDQKPARRFPALDNNRALHSRTPHDAIAIVSKDGRLSLGAFALDMTKLTIEAVPATRAVVDAKLGESHVGDGSPFSEIWLLDEAGTIERGIVRERRLEKREKVTTMGGALVLGEQGRVLKRNGELWSATGLLRKASPITSLVGDAPCGATEDGQLRCLDAAGHLSASMGAAGDRPAIGLARGASGHWRMVCTVGVDGAPLCSGRDDIGLFDRRRRTARSTEAHPIPLGRAP